MPVRELEVEVAPTVLLEGVGTVVIPRPSVSTTSL
jgi:hypothetical protein